MILQLQVSSSSLDIGVLATLLTAFFALVALIFTAIEIRRSRKSQELAILDRAFNNIINTEKLLYEEFAGKSEEVTKQWDSLFLNQLEYFSFLVNKNYLTNKELLRFFMNAVISWYENIFELHSTDQEKNDKDVYPELKELYKKMKELKSSRLLTSK